jgi:DHA2 family multidrug resistance protein
VLSLGAILLLIEMPLVGWLTSKVQARYLIAFGWLAMALAMHFSTTHFGLFLDFWSATRVRTAQVVGIGFLFVPITLVAYVGIPQEQSNMVSGLINFMRNIGSSVGTSAVTTLIARRSQYHQTVLIDNLTSGASAFLNSVKGLTNTLTQAGYSFNDALARAHELLYTVAQQQSATLAYIDTFWILGVAAAIMFALSFTLKKNEPGQGAVHAE